MFAAVRPALRSASPARRPPARFIRRRRYPLPHRIHVHGFHTSRYFAQNPNSSPSPDNAAVDGSGANNKPGEEKAAAEKADAGATSEDPEILAEKLQRSREMTRRYSSALRRSQRRNRAQDLAPIHIPNWFLDIRVQLREGALPHRHAQQQRTCTLSIKHTESGDHGTCSIPFLTHATSVRSIARIIKDMWGNDISKELKVKLARNLSKRLKLEYDGEIVKVLENVPDVNAMENTAIKAEDLEDIQEIRVENAKKREVGEKSLSVQKSAEDITKPSKEQETEIGAQHRKQKLGNLQKTISPLLHAEVRAAVAASLTAVHPSNGDSFPSAKTNLILHSPSNDHDRMLNSLVQSVASELGADVVVLQAQDLARLGGDYLGEGPEPSPHSIRSLGYETYKFGPDFAIEIEEIEKEEALDDEQDSPKFFILNSLKEFSQRLRSAKSFRDHANMNAAPGSIQPTRAQTQQELQLEDLKLSTLLEALVDSTDLKRNRGSAVAQRSSEVILTPASSTLRKESELPKLFDFSFPNAGPSAELDITSALPLTARETFTFTLNNSPSLQRPQVPRKPKMIYVKDVRELNATQYGSRIVQKLEDIVRKQRNAGESIMIIGTTCSLDLTPELSSSGVQKLQSDSEAGFFRTIVVTPGTIEDEDVAGMGSLAKDGVVGDTTSEAERRKFRTINLRHIQDMLRCLDPASTNIADMEQGFAQIRKFGPIFPESYFRKVLTYDEVHRIALTAFGLHVLDSSNTQLSWAHVALAMGLLKASDRLKSAYMRIKNVEHERSMKDRYHEQLDMLRGSRGQESLRRGRELSKSSPGVGDRPDLHHIRMNASSHEKRLMPGIVNADEIKTTFNQVHVPLETIEAIRTLTSMSLLRPDAFNYGVLATEKISGALLYGPPGTGKTLLAKAVAKESGSTVLEVSGSSIMDKYVGEGEKNVAAVFSLARKLSPCIVFLDEADALFGTRDSSRERTSHRDILNQFLKEWDGLNDLSSVFVMVATNRPFDMDDAVIRRLPRRLLVDLPTQEDREKIIEIHLKGEQLDASVDLKDLAKRTPLYSGSDLKNVAVFAALACVREENEHAAIAAAKAATNAAQAMSESHGNNEPVSSTATTQTSPVLVQGIKYDFPERRILHMRHFEKALQEVSASISENMSSLSAIKKFDEQYGDRKGRRKKTYGFGVNVENNESAARVRN